MNGIRLACCALVVLVLLMGSFSCATTVPAPTSAPSPVPATKPATPTPTPKPVVVKEWISATAPETSSSYVLGQALARVTNRELEKANIPLKIKNVASTGTGINFRLYSNGEADMHAMNTQANPQAWTNTGPFAQEPLKHKSYQGVYLFSVDQFPVVAPGNKDKIKSYSDFAGRKVWPYNMGSTAYEATKTAFEGLGIWNKIEVRQLGQTEVGSSLKSGLLDVAIMAATTGGRTGPPWVQELIATVDVSVVNPTDKEKTTISALEGLTPTIFPAYWLFGKQNAGVTDVWSFSVYQGWNFPSYGTIDEVYAIVKIWYEHTADLVALDPTFKQFTDGGLQFNARVLDSLPGIPVHPGVARYYKERGIWKDTWKVGEVQPKNW